MPSRDVVERWTFPEHFFERITVSDDSRKLPFGPTLALKIAPFLSQSLLQLVDLGRRSMILDCDRQLHRHLIDQFHIVAVERIGAGASENDQPLMAPTDA